MYVHDQLVETKQICKSPSGFCSFRHSHTVSTLLCTRWCLFLSWCRDLPQDCDHHDLSFIYGLHSFIDLVLVVFFAAICSCVTLKGIHQFMLIFLHFVRKTTVMFLSPSASLFRWVSFVLSLTTSGPLLARGITTVFLIMVWILSTISLELNLFRPDWVHRVSLIPSKLWFLISGAIWVVLPL